MKYNLIFGMRTRDWWTLLRENRFAISPRYWPRALIITLVSLLNEFFSWRETRRHGPAILKTRIAADPVFILGHWRSGTTHLQRLLAQDDRFAFVNGYQTTNPHSYLTTEQSHSRLLAGLVPARRLEDNMTLSFAVPSEDEVALSILSPDSPYLIWSFPRNRERYNRSLTLEELDSARVEAWKKVYFQYVQKLTYRYGRPLILKSPPNTCRVKQLLELFPRARFIHIHRDPFEVFQSMLHLIEAWTANYAVLQTFPAYDKNRQIIEQYRLMYDKYFREIPLIPVGSLHELAFRDLEKDPLGQVEHIYDRLELGDFAKVRGDVGRYCESVSGYRRNKYAPLPDDIRALIAERWSPSFAAWGYPAG